MIARCNTHSLNPPPASPPSFCSWLTVPVWSCLQLRLNQEQRQEKETAEAAIEDLKEQITLAEGDDAKAELQTQIDTKQTTLNDLMENFAVRRDLSPFLDLLLVLR